MALPSRRATLHSAKDSLRIVDLVPELGEGVTSFGKNDQLSRRAQRRRIHPAEQAGKWLKVCGVADGRIGASEALRIDIASMAINSASIVRSAALPEQMARPVKRKRHHGFPWPGPGRSQRGTVELEGMAGPRLKTWRCGTGPGGRVLAAARAAGDAAGARWSGTAGGERVGRAITAYSRDGDQSFHDGDHGFQVMAITGSRDRDHARRHAPTDVLMLCWKWCFGQGLPSWVPP
jgi:hypothetical protein